MDNKRRRIPLSLKLNILIIGMILLVSSGLVAISYQTYCKKIDSIYFEQIERLARLCSSDVSGEFVDMLVDVVMTEEFQTVRAQAEEKQDPSVLLSWLKEQSCKYESATSLVATDSETGEEIEQQDQYIAADTLYDSLYQLIREMRDIYDVRSVYIQFDRDGVTYNLVDSFGDLLKMGTVEPPMPEFAAYGDNEEIPATIVEMDGEWVCTACVPARKWSDGSVTGLVGAELSMADVFSERRWFLWNCLLFVIALTVISCTVAMILFRRTVSEPLMQLSDAAAKFGNPENGESMGDLISLDIHSQDEIGDLYEEIRSMEMRIVESADNLAQAAAEKQRTLTELNNAAQIQAAMLPGVYQTFPERKEFDLYASMTPAKEVGGDFYDYFMQDDDHLVLVIADVSGKGMPAALFMMAAKILIKERGRAGDTPAGILAAANNRLSENNTYRMFVTAWVGILELSTGKMLCASAGHEYPALQGPDGQFALLKDKHGFVLGVKENMRYTNYEIQMPKDSAIFVYTDGVKEAMNAEEEQYSTDRMLEALNLNPDAAPEQLLEQVRTSVDEFVGDAPQFDDLTMLALRFHLR